MLKKIMLLILVIAISVLGYYVYTVASEEKYSINLEEGLIIDGVSYEKIDDNWVTDERLDLDSLGRIDNGITDYIISTKIYPTKSQKCISLHNYFKNDIYIDKEYELPEFRKNNLEYVILNNERVKNPVMESKEEIKDYNIINYLYDFVKDTQNKPSEGLIKKEPSSLIELYSLQFKLKNVENLYMEPSIIVSSPDGDTFIYNKNSEYLNEDGTYNLYPMDKNMVKSIIREEVR